MDNALYLPYALGYKPTSSDVKHIAFTKKKGWAYECLGPSVLLEFEPTSLFIFPAKAETQKENKKGRKCNVNGKTESNRINNTQNKIQISVMALKIFKD